MIGSLVKAYRTNFCPGLVWDASRLFNIDEKDVGMLVAIYRSDSRSREASIIFLFKGVICCDLWGTTDMDSLECLEKQLTNVLVPRT